MPQFTIFIESSAISVLVQEPEVQDLMCTNMDEWIQEITFDKNRNTENWDFPYINLHTFIKPFHKHYPSHPPCHMHRLAMSDGVR